MSGKNLIASRDHAAPDGTRQPPSQLEKCADN